MDFSASISAYKESDSTKSPICIWYQKEKESAKCLICQTSLTSKSFATTNLINHLKRHHGFLKKYNAWKEYEELSSMKEARISGLKRKNSEISPVDEPIAKQQKIESKQILCF